MKLPFTCPQCDQENRENGNFIPSIEQRDIIITNQITYEYTCSKGHQCFYVLQIERFEMLYKLAIHEFLENNFRACVINCAAALERFYEFFLQVVFHHNGYSNERFYEEIWLPIKERSKRQEALFKDTFIELTSIEKTPVLKDTLRKFRNHIVHQGEFPKKEQTRDFADTIFRIIGIGLYTLHKYCNSSIEVIKHEHLQRRFRSRPSGNLHSTTILLNTNFPSYDKIWTSNDFNVYVKDTAKEHEIYEVYLKQAIPVLNMLQGSTNSKDLREILVKIIMDVLDDNSINMLFSLVTQICNELNASQDKNHKK